MFDDVIKQPRKHPWKGYFITGAVFLWIVLAFVACGLVLKQESTAKRAAQIREAERIEKQVLEDRAREAAERERAAKQAEWDRIWRRTNPRAARILDKHPEWSKDACVAISEKRVHIGMTAEQVRTSWGRPEDVNRTVVPGRTHEQWVYGSTYLYFEDGVMTSFQD